MCRGKEAVKNTNRHHNIRASEYLRVQAPTSARHNGMQAGPGKRKEDIKEHTVTQRKTPHLEGTYGGAEQLRGGKVLAGSESIQSEQMKIQVQFPSSQSRINGKHSAS